MKPDVFLTHEFVDFIPKELKELTVYVSIPFATAVHKCCCGCGKKVVTPLSPTDWKVIFDGISVSLDPSIGNWNYECRSHYWIQNNKVRWAARWSQRRIDSGKADDARAKNEYFRDLNTLAANTSSEGANDFGSEKSKDGIWKKLKKRFRHK